MCPHPLRAKPYRMSQALASACVAPMVEVSHRNLRTADNGERRSHRSGQIHSPTPMAELREQESSQSDAEGGGRGTHRRRQRARARPDRSGRRSRADCRRRPASRPAPRRPAARRGRGWAGTTEKPPWAFNAQGGVLPGLMGSWSAAGAPQSWSSSEKISRAERMARANSRAAAALKAAVPARILSQPVFHTEGKGVTPPAAGMLTRWRAPPVAGPVAGRRVREACGRPPPGPGIRPPRPALAAGCPLTGSGHRRGRLCAFAVRAASPAGSRACSASRRRCARRTALDA